MSVFGQPFRTAVVSIAAVLASFSVVYCLCRALGVNATPAILAATLALSLSRRTEVPDRRKFAAEIVLLPLIALTAGLVGRTLLNLPPVGATLFTAGMALSVLLRKFGAIPRTLGRIIAIPLIAILVVPVHIEGIAGRWLPVALMIAAGLAAMMCSVGTAWFAGRIGWTEADVEQPAAASKSPAPAKRSLHIAERMALQMLVALGLAFAIGMVAFPAHWAWVVLTAFIVCSGAVSRGDAVYKGLLRLGGAVGGAILAAAMAHFALPGPACDAAIIFALLFIGLWLRQINYAWWAVCVTVIFALLQGPQDQATLPLLGMRIVCIFIGALCGVAATWFVYPIRSEQIARKRVAEALHALRDALASGQLADMSVLDRHAAELERLAPPLRLHRRLVGSTRAQTHPAAWIERMRELITQTRTGEFDRARLGAQMRELGAMLKARTQEPANPDQVPSNTLD
jgi:hypothetical protein